MRQDFNSSFWDICHKKQSLKLKIRIMILFKDVCSILGQFRKYFLHWPQKGFTSSTILHMYIHIHFSLGFRKRFFQKLTLECVFCCRFYSTSYVLCLCHLNQKWPKGHRTEPQRFRAAVKMRNTKRMKFEINLKLRKCGDHCCGVWGTGGTEWHLSVTLPSNFRRFADSDSGSGSRPHQRLCLRWHCCPDDFF